MRLSAKRRTVSRRASISSPRPKLMPDANILVLHKFCPATILCRMAYVEGRVSRGGQIGNGLAWRSVAIYCRITKFCCALYPAIPNSCRMVKSVLMKLGNVAIELQGFRIGQRLAVLHLASVHDVAHGQFHDLSRLGARNIADGDDFRRDMARRGAGTDFRLDAGLEIVVQRDTLGKPHEQHHPHIL